MRHMSAKDRRPSTAMASDCADRFKVGAIDHCTLIGHRGGSGAPHGALCSAGLSVGDGDQPRRGIAGHRSSAHAPDHAGPDHGDTERRG